MYTHDVIEGFLKKLLASQNPATRSGKEQTTNETRLRSFVSTADENEPSPADLISQIDKTQLKETIEQQDEHRHKAIRLIAEICKLGRRRATE